MQIAVLGTGVVGRTLGSRCVELGHRVVLGSRTTDHPAAVQWAATHPAGAAHADFATAVRGADLIVNATAGLHSLAAFDLVGADALGDTVVADVSNPLDFSEGFPPTVRQDGGRSVAERLQARFPHARVVKTLNTVTAAVMVQPQSLAEPTTTFLAGDDEAAKAFVADLLVAFGWDRAQVVDLGDVTAARPLESYLALWLRLLAVQSTPIFNVRLVRAGPSAVRRNRPVHRPKSCS